MYNLLFDYVIILVYVNDGNENLGFINCR